MGVPLVYFNSWSEQYRRPFGAVRIGSVIYFSIQIEQDVAAEVNLMIQKDGNPFHEVLMNQAADESRRFTCKFETEGTPGLYFYHFRITFQEEGNVQTIYYCKAADLYGGEGRIVSDLSQVEQYQMTCFQYADPAPEWYLHGVIYHIFVDRFFNGNRHKQMLHPKKNSFIYATEEDRPYYIRDKNDQIARWDFFGGNLSGIIAKLVNLKRLGVTILYLSPIFEARSNHKYDTGDFRKIDPMFGDEKIFKKLVSKAGQLGIRVILDGVFNHVGVDSVYFNRYGNYGSGGAYQDASSPYHDWFTFHSDRDHYDCWWSITDLPTVNKAKISYQKFIYDSEESVVDTWTETGIGGWRLDVADELSDGFIAGIRNALQRHEKKGEHKVLIGEVWEDATNKIAYGKRRHYLEGGMLHGVMNYPFRDMVVNLINGKINARQAVRSFMTLKSNYPPEALLANMNNLGTHDTERILTVFQESQRKLRLAVWLLMALPGVPCIYYGDEAGVVGGKDPDNRSFYPWGKENQQLKAVFQEAIHARRTDPHLQHGAFYPFSLGPLFGCLRYVSMNQFTVLLVNPTRDSVNISLGQLKDETNGSLIRSCLQSLDLNRDRSEPMEYHYYHFDRS
ncbi:glycoside hydrolase family 13 protein [Sporolactobacillus terrae]|uniref:glycoside hydrolase family 13 protein n=1 Tax=Sporolactobacillus terrae TaxID=269673 RepID=UPI00055DED42|nr:glycoside hydrolase family 13 protein [Sporolactobacillus terrae]